MKKTVVFLSLALLLMGNSFTSLAITTTSGTKQTGLGEVTETPQVTSVSDAMKEFKSMSRKERKEKMREVRKEIKQFKANKKSGAEPSTNTLLLVILAILLPPLAVYLHEGETNNKFWLSLILTLLFFVPGVIYALIVVLGDS